MNTLKPESLQERLSALPPAQPYNGHRKPTPANIRRNDSKPLPAEKAPMEKKGAKKQPSNVAHTLYRTGTMLLYATPIVAITTIGIQAEREGTLDFPIIQNIPPDKLSKTIQSLERPNAIINTCRYVPSGLRKLAVRTAMPEAEVLTNTLCAFARQTDRNHIQELTRSAAIRLRDGNLTWQEVKHLQLIATNHNMTLNCTTLTPELDSMVSKNKNARYGKETALFVANCISTPEFGYRMGKHIVSDILGNLTQEK